MEAEARSFFKESPGGLGQTVYIVIPVYNRRQYTHDCLASFKKQDYPTFKMIVVDDGSTDGTADMIRQTFPETVLLRGNGDLWWVGAINKGIRYALSVCQPNDFILVINDDLVVPANYVSSLMHVANLHEGSIIGSVETTNDAPKIIKSGGESIKWALAKRHVVNKGRSLDHFPHGHIVKVESLTGRGTLFPCKVFREAGLYDEVHFRQCGDTELPMRANFKFGYPLLVSYDAVVISYPGSTNNINDKQTYTLSDFKEYFFGIRSHFNLIDKFWIAYSIAPNKLWFARYYFFNVLRTVGRFITRLSFRNA